MLNQLVDAKLLYFLLKEKKCELAVENSLKVLLQRPGEMVVTILVAPLLLISTQVLSPHKTNAEVTEVKVKLLQI